MVAFDAQLVEEDGRRVTVERAAVPDGGFVVIHLGSVDDDIVGNSAYLPPGVHRHVDVRLHAEERVTNRQVVTAALHRDSDGDEVFDFLRTADDGPYTVDDQPVFDTAVVFAPELTPTPEPTPTPVPSDPEVTATPSTTPSSTTATGAAGDGIPGFGIVAALVAAGAGVLAALRRR